MRSIPSDLSRSCPELSCGEPVEPVEGAKSREVEEDIPAVLITVTTS
jgi:hypothetical protein